MMQDIVSSGLFLLLAAASLHMLWVKGAAQEAIGAMAGLWIIFRYFFKDVRLRFAAAILMAGVSALALVKIEDTFISFVWVIGILVALFFEVRELACKGKKEG